VRKLFSLQFFKKWVTPVVSDWSDDRSLGVGDEAGRSQLPDAPQLPGKPSTTGLVSLLGVRKVSR
jgi:hypothetical protein